LTWLANGETVLSSGADNTIRIWNHKALWPTHTLSDLGPVACWNDCWPSAVGFSPDGNFLAFGTNRLTRLWGLPSGRLSATLACLPGNQWLVCTPAGHFRGSPDIEQELVYVVQTNRDREGLTPEEFTKKYGWKNDPGRVRFTGK
jgi:WD40 repeat protein